ncbi:lipopolysaccharide biosynthesis protein [Mycetocola tolaasinivorans]|uniref:Lipopolysaccharide biosynthesis protein n=1 Tax=Mycetocola tolaasinivorans TaxID=76635 RepID=A0A3L7AAU9_9MICO|nr:lipopolysaccharide biosynthesis protein [Mycetocola tolaasinivorans]RLP77433.1 lipopolysaccharide biosynthesis protein [Mycetocola tolaasinivorans]
MPKEKTLGYTALRGASVTMLGQIARVIVQFAGIIIMARLLPPSDFGLLAMVAVILGFGEVFRDLGLSGATIQAKIISDAQRDKLFWINTMMGAVLTLVMFGASWLIADLYHEPQLVPITQVLSLSFLLNGLATQFSANLARAFKFTQLAIVAVASISLGLIAGIGFAIAGAGVWALVAQQMTQTIVYLILSVAFSGWLPRGWKRDASVRSLVSFGGYLFATQLLNFASRSVDSLLVGRRYGAEQLGIYDRAFQLLMLPLEQLNTPATRVALPILSRLKDDREKFGRFLVQGQFLLVTTVSTVLIYVATFADVLVPFALGPQWGKVVPLFQILAVAGVFQAAHFATYWVFFSQGKSKQNMYFALVTRPLVIIGIVIGLIWGIQGVAVAYVVSSCVLWLMGLVWISRITFAPVRAMLGNGLMVVATMAVTGGASWYFREIVGNGGVWNFILSSVVFFAILATALLANPISRRRLFQVREILAERKAPNS